MLELADAGDLSRMVKVECLSSTNICNVHVLSSIVVGGTRSFLIKMIS